MNQKNEIATMARAAWAAHGGLPDWVEALAVAVDTHGWAETERRIGYSHSVVWEIVRAAYKARTERVERAVREALMRLTVECPVTRGVIDGAACLDHQRRPYCSGNPTAIQFFRGCRRCPQATIAKAKPETAA